MTKLRFLVMSAFLLVAVPAAADELRLTNGDRYTGTVVRLADGTLTFKTANGELHVPWKDVAGLRTEAPLMVTRGGALPQSAVVSGEAADLADITAIEPPAPPIEWKGGASAGLLASSGNTDVNTLRMDGDVNARTRADRYTASGILNRSTNASVETTRNWNTAFGYDRFVSRRLFIEGSLILTNDKFRDLTLRTAAGVGLGYDVWKGPNGTLSVNGGYGYVRENFTIAPDDSYSALREAVKLDLTFAGSRLGAFHHHDGYFGVSGDNKSFFRAQNGLRAAIVKGFVATLEWDVDYNRSPSPGRKTTDRTLSLTFGYRF